MRNRAFVLLGLVSILAACQSGGDSSSSAGAGANAEKGKQLYATVCITCHGPTGEGIQGLGKSLQANAFVKAKSDDEVVAMLKEGRTADHPENTTKVAMPPKGGNPGLTDQDLKDIVAFLRTL
ncbi:MAG: c-type cytochrome [Candidatus Binatia bacterium]